MNILITGGNGFIGKHLIKSLSRDNAVFCLIRDSSNRDFYTEKGIEVIVDDGAIDSISEFIDKNNIEGIVHLASLYIKSHENKDVAGLIESNVMFGSRLLEASSKTRVKWFLNVGTFWQHYQSNAYCPVNLYAATKQAFESILKFYVETTKIKFSTLKLSDTFGPSDSRPKVFNLLDKTAKSGDTLNMSGGEQLMDVSFIDDVVSGFLNLIGALSQGSGKIKSGNVYALKAKKTYTLKEIVSIFESTTGQAVNINWGALPYREREVMIPWEGGSMIPNWTPVYSLEEGIIKTFGSVR